MVIDVIYQAWANGYGIDAPREFIKSYKAHPAGCKHKLTIVANGGWEKLPEQYSQLEVLANDVGAKLINLSNDDFALDAYYSIAKRLGRKYIFCIATTAKILHDNWLDIFENTFKQNANLEFAGVCGSWESCSSVHAMLSEELKKYDKVEDKLNIVEYNDIISHQKKYPITFPNYHISSPAFMINRHLFIKYMNSRTNITHKCETHDIENAYTGITKYVLCLGHNIGIIGADGILYKKENWNKSKTFRVMDTSNLLISDRQTEIYENASLQEKDRLNYNTWADYRENTSKEDIEIFVVYNSTSNIYFQNDILTPIQTGCVNTQLDLHFLKDNSGDNISHKNQYFGEYTAHYWVWKNYLKEHPEKKYIGFAHYRRLLEFQLFITPDKLAQPHIISHSGLLNFFYTHYYDTNTFDIIKQYDICLVKHWALSNNIEEQYCGSGHPKIDLYLFKEILYEYHPEYLSEFKDFLLGHKANFVGPFVMKRELFIEFCEWVFPMLLELEKRRDWSQFIDTYNERIAAFLWERVFNVWLRYKQKNSPLNILECSCLLALDPPVIANGCSKVSLSNIKN